LPREEDLCYQPQTQLFTFDATVAITTSETMSSTASSGSPELTEEGEQNGTNNNGIGDTIDAKPDFLGVSSSVRPPQLTVAVDAVDYNMAHARRGKCLIINNRTFQPRTKLNERLGTEKDREALFSMWTDFNFDVEVLNDKSCYEIRRGVQSLSEQDFTDFDCLAVCVLTHGDRGVLWGCDNRYAVDDLYQPFTADKCPSLAGKPKLFFIQACQGSGFDRGTFVKASETDAVDSAQYYKIPTWADFLIMYSTIPGYYSWRNPSNGSWFIQALASVMPKHAHEMDLLSMLTLVNRKVAYEYESFCPGQGDFDGNKQVPCITSMLTRRVFLTSNIV